VLQSGEFTRVGSSKVSKTDVRVVCATNVDLRYAVNQGKFREDLYYRLNAVQINMPALRERKDDIYLLFRKFVADYSEQFGMKRITLGRDAIEMLRNYRWPGNIRQLKNVAETMQTLEAGKTEISAATLSKYIPKDDPNAIPVRVENTKSGMSEDERQEIFRILYSLSSEVNELKKKVMGGSSYPVHNAVPSEPEHYVAIPQNEWSKEDVDIHDDPEKEDVDEQYHEAEPNLSIRGVNDELIRKALEKHHGNRKKAAEELGISERTLYRKLPPEYKNKKYE